MPCVFCFSVIFIFCLFVCLFVVFFSLFKFVEEEEDTPSSIIHLNIGQFGPWTIRTLVNLDLLTWSIWTLDDSDLDQFGTF